MNELMHRRADSTRRQQDKQKALLERARALTPDQARRLAANLKENHQDADTYWTLYHHYEFKGDVIDLDALRLWYIEHQPGGKIWPGCIDPRLDHAGYERGRTLWMAHVKRPGATAEIYQRAADFLEGGDKPLAEEVLQAGWKAYPNDARWAEAFGRHYAQVLLGLPSAQEAQNSYAQSVRARLAGSTDVRVLARTAKYLEAWGGGLIAVRRDAALDAMQLARTYVDRALSIEPDSELACTKNSSSRKTSSLAGKNSWRDCHRLNWRKSATATASCSHRD
jgi:hypothetical protein